MSASLMSCVRENSPPLDVLDGAHCSSAAAETAPLSLQDMPSSSGCHLTSTPLSATNVSGCSAGADSVASSVSPAAAATNTEPSKRRRFHPLRKLGRIFRRRTITNGAEAPSNVPQSLPAPASSNSEKNLRSATLSSISSVVSASSPSSPLTHQQLQDAYSSQSLPKSKSYSNASGSSVGGGGNTSIKSPRKDALLASLLGKNRTQQQQQKALPEEQDNSECEMYTTTSSLYHNHQLRDGASALHFQSTHHHSTTMRQAIGVAVLPSAMNRSFYAERQKLRSIGDSSQELDSSGNDSSSARPSGTHIMNGHGGGGNGVVRTAGGSASGGEMTDSQRSLSEGRLVDSDFCHDPLSQSHDSVFSESATASLFSNRDYQAELSDVLRKRNRNRPDASEEDLGLPRSPATPPRRANNAHHNKSTAGGHSAPNTTPPSNTTGNQSEVSSLSLLSMNSGDGDEILAASTANNSLITATDAAHERSNGSSTRFLTRSSTTYNSSTSSTEYSRLTMSTSFGNESKDEPDLFNTSFQRLSHSAAKHKMAVRPTKKKGPSRHHRRTLETSIPEANEDNLKAGSNILLDTTGQESKSKVRSLPPVVKAKPLDKHTETPKKSTATATVTPTKSKATTAGTAINGGDQPISIKRTKLEKIEKIDSDTIVTKTTTSTSTTNTSATNLFGFRAFSTKASALFDSSRESSTDPSPDEIEQPKEIAAHTQVENSESGFLRRLIQRNSKRSIAHSNNNNSETDNSQSEPKKLQVSASCFDVKPSNTLADLITVEKSKSAVAYEQSVEETRKDIKREIMSVGTTGLSAMLNSYTLSSASSNSSLEKTTVTVKEPTTNTHKPKSGPAARQRYVPQDIDTMERKTKTSSTASLSDTTSREENDTKSTTSNNSNITNNSIFNKTAQQETFQSTSIIREITASQALTSSTSISGIKPEHHYEKKPKIVGLSAFQQKISRSNDSFSRNASQSNSTSTSSNSLDAAGESLSFLSYEQKQRKAVEKSRSFRTYQEETTSSTTVHNNMPSLPDLTLNLRVPCYNDHTFILQDKEYSSPSPPDPAHDRSISLGFEINDNNLVKTAPRAESTGHLPTQHSSYNLASNVIVKTTPTKLLTPATMMPKLSPTNSCNQDLTEIEQNIDLLVKSPFISVLRKPTVSNTLDEKHAAVTICSVNNGNNNRKNVEKITEQKQIVVPLVPVTPIEKEQTRPKLLNLKEATTASKEAAAPPMEGKTTPSTSTVPLREKPKLHGSMVARNAIDEEKIERKSAPSPTPASKTSNPKLTKRSSSLMDSTEEVVHAGGKDNVPEFMKIQLHRVDPARMAKSANVVLAKNVREPATQPSIQPTTQLQQQTQTQPQSPTATAATAATAATIATLAATTAKSPTTKEVTRADSIEELYMRRLSNESVEIIEKGITTPPEQEKPEKPEKPRNVNTFDVTINKSAKPLGLNYARNNVDLPPKMSPVKKPPAMPTTQPNTPTEEPVVLRIKPATETPITENVNVASNKLSLQDRKRLFMNEEKMKMEKKIEELRNERKRSITEEVYRKSFAKSEEKLESATEKPATENVVMLRKKSFSAATQPLNGHANTNGNNSNTPASGTKDDHTPELMKVFARRSLKIKDEDITALSEKILANNAGNSGSGNGIGGGKKFQPSQQNVDSDKENQSASEEKLDKLPKIETAHSEHTHTHTQPHANGKLSSGMSGHGHHHHNGTYNRNSLGDFRNATALTPKCSNNSNNNNAAATAGTTATHSNGNNAVGMNNRSFLAPIKGGSTGGIGSSGVGSSAVSAFRNMPIERNASVSKIYGVLSNASLANNNNNNNSNNSNTNNSNNNLSNLNNNNNLNSQQQQQNGKGNGTVPTFERQSLNIKVLESNSVGSSSGSGISSSISAISSNSNSNSSSTTSTNSSNSSFSSNNKTFERSATVSEFKGIHQRRAEWEQRAKEALK